MGTLKPDLIETAQRVRDAMPCSVELPAGTGKTQVIAALGAMAEARGERALILTHTNAGVQALRRRARSLGVASSSVQVETIASWSHALIRHYPQIAQLSAPSIPDWAASDHYYAGACLVARCDAYRRVLGASYAFIVVDEYQDCTTGQHELVMALSDALPLAVFGDRLQSIFNFGGNVPVQWERDVEARWPAMPLVVQPWRWAGHNEMLGEWLLDIREYFRIGTVIPLKNAPINWREKDPRTKSNICFDMPSGDGSVVAIGQLPHDCVSQGRYLRGTYTVMEELEGKFMLKFAQVIDTGAPVAVAQATAEFGKDCAAKVAEKLDSRVIKNLAAGKPVTNLKREGAKDALERLSRLLEDPSPGRVREALCAIGDIPGVHMYRHEAWRTVLAALNVASPQTGTTVASAVAQIRNRARATGRGEAQRVISRPLLIKGLEYDHSLILDADNHDVTSLYVALTRARKTLTIISRETTLKPIG